MFPVYLFYTLENPIGILERESVDQDLYGGNQEEPILQLVEQGKISTKETMNKREQPAQHLTEYPSTNLKEVDVKHGNTLSNTTRLPSIPKICEFPSCMCRLLGKGFM